MLEGTIPHFPRDREEDYKDEDHTMAMMMRTRKGPQETDSDENSLEEDDRSGCSREPSQSSETLKTDETVDSN